MLKLPIHDIRADNISRGSKGAVGHKQPPTIRLWLTTEECITVFQFSQRFSIANLALTFIAPYGLVTLKSYDPLHVMRAMDIPYTAAHNTYMFSLTRYKNTSEVDEVLKVMPDIAAKLHKLSRFWDSVNNEQG